MRAVWVVGLLALSACKPSEAEVLEARYESVVGKSDALKSCADERKIADAFAREGEQEKYNRWKLSADMQCLHEETLRSIGR